MKNFWFAEKANFFSSYKANRKKAFFSTQRHRLPTAPKLTCSHTFHLRQLTVSLQQNNSFSKNISLALARQPPFRTDSKPLRRRFAGKPGFVTCRRNFLQNHFRQSFESSPKSRGPQTSGVLLVLFVHAKSTKNVPFAGSSEVFQTSNQPTAAAASHRNN